MPSAVTYRWSWASWTMVLPRLDELRALEAMLSYKKAVYHLAGLEWVEAGRAFRQAHE